jgi:hypothetical protein
MAAELIPIEEALGSDLRMLVRLMRLVPDRDKDDDCLRRLVAIRLLKDGEKRTQAFLLTQIRKMIQSAYTGRLYDFIRDDARQGAASGDGAPTDPPDIA